MKTEALKFLDRLGSGRVLVIGDLILDRFIWGCVERISPEAPVPVVKVERESVHLGGAANVLSNLAALGSVASIVGLIGVDGNGEELKSLLLKRGVDVSGLVASVSHPTIQKTRIIAHQQQVVRVDREKAAELESDIRAQILQQVITKLSQVDAVIISDYGKGVVDGDLIRHLTRLPNRPMISVDPKDRNFDNYHDVDILTPNQNEAERMSGVKISDSESLVAAAGRIFDVLSCERLLITRGERGMALFEDPKSYYEIPTQAREVYDVSGAGDTVIATYTLARAAGAHPRLAAYLANAAAGVVVAKLGTAEVSIDELEQALSKKHEEMNE